MPVGKRAICIICALHFALHANKVHYGISNYVRVPLIKIVIVIAWKSLGKTESCKFSCRWPAPLSTPKMSEVAFCAAKCVWFIYELRFCFRLNTHSQEKCLKNAKKMQDKARRVENAFGNAAWAIDSPPKRSGLSWAELTRLNHESLANL